MFKSITKSLGGDPARRVIAEYAELVAKINALEPEVARLSDEALRAKTDDFRARLASGASRDDLLPEAFATVREASVRTVGLRHFDVQLIGGVVLDQGRFAEKDRRRQDAGRHTPHLPQHPRGEGRSPGDGERLPGPPRRPLDGPDLPVPRPLGGRAAGGRPDGARPQGLPLRSGEILEPGRRSSATDRGSTAGARGRRHPLGPHTG